MDRCVMSFCSVYVPQQAASKAIKQQPSTRQSCDPQLARFIGLLRRGRKPVSHCTGPRQSPVSFLYFSLQRYKQSDLSCQLASHKKGAGRQIFFFYLSIFGQSQSSYFPSLCHAPANSNRQLWLNFRGQTEQWYRCSHPTLDKSRNHFTQPVKLVAELSQGKKTHVNVAIRNKTKIHKIIHLCIM